MTSIIGGFDRGLQDTSLFLLNRNDSTGEGVNGHEEQTYVNVSNGNLVIQHRDAYLPSQGEDFSVLRTYNSRGKSWELSTMAVDLSQITNNKITLFNADTSRYTFY